MKDYTVYYVIKKNNHGYLNHVTVEAKNQKEAIQIVRHNVRESIGKNAFYATCKAPVITRRGFEFNDCYWSRYNEKLNCLW